MSSVGDASPPAPASTAGLVGWAMYDFANSAFATVIQTFVFAAYFTSQVAVNGEIGTSQWGWALAAAGLLVAVGGPVLGAAADQGGRRKPWIIAFTLLGVGLTAGLWFVHPRRDDVWLALVLAAAATVAAEASTIFYNTMLGDLVESARLGRWSGWGWGAGYAGGLICLVVALFVFIKPEGAWLGLNPHSDQHVRATFLLTAGWWLVFSLPLMLLTPDAPAAGKPFLVAARDGLGQLRASIGHVRRYRHIVRFLIARMIFIDGLATTFAFGGIYAKNVFAMTDAQVLEFGIALNVTAGLGAAAFAWIDDWLGSRTTILLSLVGLVVSGAVMLAVGSPPWIAWLGPGGAAYHLGPIVLGRDQMWFWICGLILGVFVGPAQSASRSYLARVAPPDLRNQMFGLFALSGKATAFLGPLLVGWITYLAHSQRVGMTTVIAFFLIGLLLMLSVPQAADAPAVASA